MVFAQWAANMLQIYVNDAAQTFTITPKTWGDLLECLDTDAAAAGRILSSARFDGVEEPSFREPSAIARPLSGVARVDVRTAQPVAFLRECLLEAIPGLEETARRARHLADIYRGHDLKPGHEGLQGLASDLAAVAALSDMLSGPLGIDLAQITVEGVSAARHAEHMARTIDALVSAQEDHDWVTVADVLEYELEPAVRRWAALLTIVSCNLQQIPATA
jgi:hypothetical protein